jgi:hypothetical protein
MTKLVELAGSVDSRLHGRQLVLLADCEHLAIPLWTPLRYDSVCRTDAPHEVFVFTGVTVYGVELWAPR